MAPSTKEESESVSAADAAAADAAAMPEIDDRTTAFSHVPEHGFSLFLAKRTKTVHFIRHAEVRSALSKLPMLSIEYT